MNALIDHARDALEAAGLEVAEVRELPTGLGWQLRCAGGEMVCAYRTGKLVPQGRNAATVRTLLDRAGPPPRPEAVPRPKVPRSSQRTDPAPLDAASTVPPSLPPGWSTEPWDGVSAPWSAPDGFSGGNTGGDG